MPSATYAHAMDVSATPDEVWTALMRPATWAQVGPVNEVWDPEYTGEALTGWKWSTDIGGRSFQGTAAAVDFEAPTKYATELDAGEMAGTITIELSGGNPTTHMDVTLDFRSKGMLSAMFFPVIKDAIGNGFAEQMDQFASTVEATD